MKARLAYLVSRYPATSHTFILREVLALRRRGFEIHTASINRPDRSRTSLTREERQAEDSTFYVKSSASRRMMAAVLTAIMRRPVGSITGFFYALWLGGFDLRMIAMNLFYYAEALLLGHWMRSEALNHVHVHFATPASTVAMIATRVWGIEFSMTVHGPDEFYGVERYRLAEKLRRARFVCAIGRYCRSQLMKVSEPEQWHKLELSPLGVDPEQFRNSGHMKTSDDFEILCVGRLVPAKGQAILLDSMARLSKTPRRIMLTLVGDGPDRTALQMRAAALGIADRVRFAGAVNQEEIRAFYRQADVFVLPSFAEGIPVVLMEAMAMGIPVVSTTVNGIPELITTGKEGILVAPSDVPELTEAIAFVRDCHQVALRMAESGRTKVVTDYNLDSNIDRLAEIMENRLGGHETQCVKEQINA